MEVNIPEILEEVTEAFWEYERALLSNDVEALKDIFWNSLHTLRYGLGEVLYGHDEITAFRNSQRGTKLEREVTRLVVTTYGRDFATANCETKRTGADIKSRQSHTWVRQPEGWRIVAAHVSAPGT
ncbi:MAG: oxalurate catabolism protein HpxZ [Rhodospirillales bacterium]|jgi:hypothetical protein|nr:oxalurate catabolism protein HpxZ [Rhodospirillales bacterium]